jgi:KaiC/GvpD/RAD55 family RecA-like ATPase
VSRLPIDVERVVQHSLEEAAPNAAIALMSDLNFYFQTMKAVVEWAKRANKRLIYVTSTIPSSVIRQQLDAEGVAIDHIYFVDCISFIVGSTGEEKERVIYIESPTMLENILLKTESWLKQLGTKNTAFFLDAMNTLAMHNDEKALSEFAYYLVNSLRVRQVMTIVLSIHEQTPEDLEVILKLVCDSGIDVHEEG